MQELGVKVPEWDHIRSSHDTVHLRSRLPEPFALDKVLAASPCFEACTTVSTLLLDTHTDLMHQPLCNVICGVA